MKNKKGIHNREHFRGSFYPAIRTLKAGVCAQAIEKQILAGYNWNDRKEK